MTLPARTVTTTGDSDSARRFGDLLVADGVITRAQLEDALRVQAATRVWMPLGQVLLQRRVVTRAQLLAVLARYNKRARLGEILLRAGRLSPPQLDAALALQRREGTPLGHALMRLRYVSEEAFRDALCTQLHINFFDLDPIAFDEATRTLVNERYAVRHRLVPLFRQGDLLVVAMDDPTDVRVMQELGAGRGLRIETVTSTQAKLERALARVYRGAPRPPADALVDRNVMVGLIRDREIAELAARALRVRILPPAWQ
jgi:type IV pilus assembly protein PilB